MIRRAVAVCCASAALVVVPARAEAQQAAFVQAFLELTSAIEGTYGDEGARVRPALDRMSSALAEWDREIAAADAALQQALRNAQPAVVVERRVSLGRAYADRGRLADALSELDEASRLQPRRVDVHVLRGLVLRASGQPLAAIEAFRAARSIDPGNPVTAYYLFHEAAISGRVNEAREAAAALAATYPKLVKPEPAKKGMPFARLALLQAAAAGPPVLPLAAYRQAYGHLARGEYERALEELRKAAAGDPLVTDPAAGSAAMNRAIGALRQGRLTEARSLLESDTLENSSEARRVLGLVYWAESDYDRSIESLTAAIRRSPRDERARLALSRVLSSAGRDADAERALQETLGVLPDSGLAHWWLASSHERVNRFADARQEFELAAAAAISGDSQLHASVGRLASGAADMPGAIDAFARAVSAHPNDPAMHKLLAAALMQQDRAGEAFAEFVAALLIDPQDADAHAGIGQIHVTAGRDADAVDAFRRAVEMSAANIETRYALASALVRLGRTQEAAPHFAGVEQAQRQMLADRRRSMSYDVLKEEAALRAAEGRLDTAIALYEKALEVRVDPAMYGQLADLYARVGRAADAARARAMYEKALREDRAGGNAR